MAVLAVAFVVLAAVPAALTDNDASGGTDSVSSGATTLYVGGAGAADTNDGLAADKSLKTIGAAITKEATTIVLLGDAGDQAEIKISKAVTIESDRNTVKDAMYKIGVKISASAGLTLKDVEVAPAKFTAADNAITVTGGALKIDGCKITISGTDGYRADGIIAKNTMTSVTINNTTFVNAGETNYTRGMFISGATTVSITGNTATGLHVFAATQNISTSLTVTGNTSKDMTGDFIYNDSETKDSKFVQIAGSNDGTVTVTKNTVTDGIPVLNVHDSIVTITGKLTVQGFMKVTGKFTVNTAEVDGDVLVQDLALSTTVASMTIDSNDTFTVKKDGSLTVAAGAKGTVLTVNGKLALGENVGLVFEKSTSGVSYPSAGKNGKITLENGASLTIKDTRTRYDTAATAGESVSIAAETNTVEIAFTGGVTQGAVDSTTISGKGTAVITGTFPLVGDGGSEVLTITAAVKGNIALLKQGESDYAKIVIKSGGSYSGTVKQATYSWDLENNLGTATVGAQAKLTNIKAGSGNNTGITITGGSIILTGSMTADEANQAIIEALSGGEGKEIKLGDASTGFTLTSGTLKLDGEITVVNNVTVSSGATLEVAKGATVDVATGKAIQADGTLSINGTVTQASGSEKKAITGTGTVEVNAGADITGVEIADTAKTVVDPSAMSEMTVGGDTQSGATTFTQVQKVIVNGSWNLVKGSKITIQGTLVVPEGTVLTIQAGAELVLEGGAVAEIEGTIVVEEAATVNGTPVKAGKLTVEANSTLKVAGIASVAGTLNASDESIINVEQDAILTVTEDGTLDVDGTPVITVKASGTMVLNGDIDGTATILDYGLVMIDSDVPLAANMNQKIVLMADGATVDVVKFTVKGDGSNISTLTITDNGLRAASYKDDNKQTQYVTIGTEAQADSVVIALAGTTSSDAYLSFTGLEATASVTSSTTKDSNSDTGGVYNYKKYTKTMDVSGSFDVSVGNIDSSSAASLDSIIPKAGVALSNGYTASTFTQVGFTVSDSVALDENVTLTVTAGKLSVSGSIAASAQGTVVNNTADLIEVTGAGEISVPRAAISSETGINAARYVTSATVSGSTVKTYHYVTLQAALAVADGADVREVVALGTQTLTESAEVAEGVTLTGSSAIVNVGASAGADVTLTVADGAAVKGTFTKIAVNGSLFAEDKTDVKVSSSIVSDVYSEEIGEDGKAVKDGWALWTNLAAAIESGVDTITISKAASAGAVEIAGNLTIPAGVTVIVPADTAALKLKDGVTLTIDGVLQTSQDITAETRFAVNALNVTGSNGTAYKSSTVVVNGALMSAEEFVAGTGGITGSTTSLKAGAPISGVYYKTEDWYVITAIDNALSVTDRTSGITVNGKVVGADGTLVANDDSETITVGTVSYTPIGANVTSADTVSTSLTMNSLTLGSGASVVMTGAFTGSVVVGDNSASFTAMEGITAANSGDALVLTGTASVGTGQSMSVSAGTVSLGTSGTGAVTFGVSSGTLKVASGAVAKVVNSSVSIAKLSVAGTLEVPSGVILTVTTQLDVTGTVSVAKATESAAAGSLVLDKSTSSSGTVTYAKAYVGMSSGDFTAASASVTGPFTLNTGASIYVASGATIDKDMSSYKSTAFYNNGSLWFTAYANGSNVTMTVDKAPVTNAVLLGWAKTEGATEADIYADEEITIGSPTKLYSVVETEIYTVIVKADEGIDNVYLDGNLMSYGLCIDDDAIYYAYTATVSAGTYTVKCTLKNGYSGDAKLALVDAGSVTASVSGTSVTVSGSEGKATFQLTGVEKSGYVDPVEPEKKDDSLTVTDYLLIVLVILVVILAVIVAMRLMRS